MTYWDVLRQEWLLYRSYRRGVVATQDGVIRAWTDGFTDLLLTVVIQRGQGRSILKTFRAVEVPPVQVTDSPSMSRDAAPQGILSTGDNPP